MNKNKLVNSILRFFLVLPISACYGNNAIILNTDDYTICSVDNYPIRRLSVYMVNSQKLFYINIKSQMKGSACVRLDSIEKKYNVEEVIRGLNTPTMCQFIPIIPFEKYEISNSSYGDAASCKIIISTNENGKINTWSIE